MDAEPARLDLGIVGDAGLGLAHLRHHARVEHAYDVEIAVGIKSQLDDPGQVIGIEKGCNLGLDIVERRERLLRRFDEGLVDLGAGLIDDVELVVQHRDRGQSPDCGLCLQELVELLAVLIEQRLGARHFDRRCNGVGADELGLLAHIGFRHDQRVLDHRAGLRREQAVEPAVERHARDDRDQDRRHRGDQ